MESLFFLVPIALIFVAVAIKILFWAIRSGQYDNLDTEAHRILFDEDRPEAPKDERPGEQRAERRDLRREQNPEPKDRKEGGRRD